MMLAMSCSMFLACEGCTMYSTSVVCTERISHSDWQSSMESNVEFLIHYPTKKIHSGEAPISLLLLNTQTRCWLMSLSLSNSGNLPQSCIVTTSWALWQPARVLTISLVSPQSLVTTPYGKADLLIIERFEPESRITQKSLRLCTEPIVSAVQIVMGDFYFGIMTFGPW